MSNTIVGATRRRLPPVAVCRRPVPASTLPPRNPQKGTSMARNASPPRQVTRLGLAALSALAVVLGLLSFGGTAQAAGANPYAPAAGHPYRHGAVPTRETFAKIRQYRQAHPNVALAANDLNYGGAVDGIGVTTGAPRVYLVFYGSQWGTAGTDANGNTTFSG